MANIILKNSVGQPIEYLGIETIEVPRADVTIVPETDFSGFAYDESAETYTLTVNPSPIAFEIGATYRVYWDGTPYVCVGQDLSAMNSGAIGVGNLANYGGTGNNEPFIMAVVLGTAICVSFTEGASHRIKLEKISASQVFSEGVAVEMPTPIPLDFSAGNQTITAPEGYLVKSATLEKPSTLLPANILEGVNVAGVVGTMEAPKPALEDVPIALDFSAGNQTITAPDGYLVKSAILQKPDTLIPENIAEGVEIAGITGAFVGGGDVTSISKVITFSSNATGTVTLFTADELSAIGFDTSKWCMVSLMAVKPGGGDWGTKRLTFNVISNQNFNRHVETTSRLTYGVRAETDVATPAAIYTTYDATPPAFSETARTNSMYYKDGAILYDATNSTNVLRNKYVLTAVCISV